MPTFLTDSADIARAYYSSRLNERQRSELGQFFTPAIVARFMAAQFKDLSGHIHLLDPGAGIGTLTAAVVERILAKSEQVKSFHVTAYEIDSLVLPALRTTLTECCAVLNQSGIPATYSLHQENFIKASDEIYLPLLNLKSYNFTHVILNPPYKKIHSQSIEKKILLNIGIDTVNFYSAFIWLSLLQLQNNGELVAITPRSFCNGTYFRSFRQFFLKYMKLTKIHIFESRTNVFFEEKVLQENIIFHALKTHEYPEKIQITNNSGETLDQISELRYASYDEVVKPSDSDSFIYIVTDAFKNHLKIQMEKMPCTLEDLNLNVSTGQIVDYRLKSALRYSLTENNTPLLYPECIKGFKFIFPPDKPRKPIAIEKNLATAKYLIKSGWYVLVKRCSSKEEKRRIVASVCHPNGSEFIGIENHLNYYHTRGKEISQELAKGLATFLNSTLFDVYFRQFSGLTQVNATDLRKVKYPCKHDLIKIGRQIDNKEYNQEIIDKIVNETLLITGETIMVIQASKKIEEALAILRALSAPKQQQNDRSALCLLALVDIQPHMSWDQASAPRRRITEMMDWFSQYYGKKYAANTRETVRRQTMHQFVQMGLVIENPDQPDRPINSPKWCYQIHEEALSLIQLYGSLKWEDNLKKYTESVDNLLRVHRRNLPMLPVTLPNGQVLQLSSGGQNVLIKDILEHFCPRFTPEGVVLYVGDASNKFIINEIDTFQKMGINLDPHGKMPDIVVYHQQQDWLILIEAVTSHGPVDLKRRNELRQLFESSTKGLVFVTAFPSRTEMVRYLAEISWETEVWIADQPEHMIHFNGERFLGPY